MNNERLRRSFIELCSIASPSGGECGIADYIKEAVKSLPVVVREIPAQDERYSRCNSLLITLEDKFLRSLEAKGTELRTPLFLAAHMDTVAHKDDPEPVILIEGDVIRTDGNSILGGDDKIGIAIALENLYSLFEESASHSISSLHPFEIIFTVAEEKGAIGARSFAASLLRAQQGFILDGESSVATAILLAPTKYIYTISSTGKKAHAGLEPEKGINAVQQLCGIATMLPSGRLDTDSTSNIGTIKGGEAVNVVPDTAQLRGELRSLNALSFQRHKSYIDQKVAQANESAAGDISISWEKQYEGYRIAESADCVLLFANACRRLKREPVFRNSSVGSDANIFNNRELTSIVMGVGMHNVHRFDEYALCSEIESAAELLRALLLPPTQ